MTVIQAAATQAAERHFYFMRHGQTAWNAAGLICGRLDPPLDDTGRRQAEAAAPVLAGLPFDGLVVSPQLRARQTAMLAVPDRCWRTDEGLRERDWGVLEGKPLAQQCGYRDTPGGGEPWADFLARVRQALQQALAGYDRPLIIAHSGVWRALRALATGAPEGPRMANAMPVEVVLSVAVQRALEGGARLGRNGAAPPGETRELASAQPVGCPIFYL